MCACRLGYSPDSIKTSAQKKLQGDQEVEGHRKKVAVRLNGMSYPRASAMQHCQLLEMPEWLQTVSSKSASKSLQEFCHDLCEAASKNTIDPVSISASYLAYASHGWMYVKNASLVIITFTYRCVQSA